MLSIRFVAVGGVAAVFSLLLSACGGGGPATPPPAGPPSITELTADRASYFIGERARLIARFENGTGRIQPGDIAVQSGQAISSPPLDYGPNELELVVTSGAASVSRTLTVNAEYRERIRSIETPFARAEHAAFRASDGRVLIVGGEDEHTTFPTSLWSFDPATEQFSDFGASLATGRIGFVFATLNDGNVLIAGGERGLVGAPSAEIIRLAERTVVPTTGQLQHPRTFAAASLLMDGRVLISGGTAAVASDSVEIYDPATGVFTLSAGRLAVGRHGHTSVRIDQRRILLYGGFTPSQQPAPPEIYDPVSGLSTALQPIEPGVRGNHEAHTMRDGGVLIIGGEDNDAAPLTTVLRFDPASGVISPFATLATPRTLFALGRLADARILLTGGVAGLSQSDVTATTETLALDATRRDGPPMSLARWTHTVTPLLDGRLLIVGGLGSDRLPQRGAEIYE